MDFCSMLKNDQAIMAVRDEAKLNDALKSSKNIIFLLKTDIMTAPELVKKCKDANKIVFIHLDLMEGIGKDEAAVRYVATHIKPDGIISTKANLIKIAHNYGLLTVFRVFLVDSQSVVSAFNALAKFAPTAIEIMPGIMGEAIDVFAKKFGNVIAGGMISKKEHLDVAVNNGALGVSTSSIDLW